MPFIRTCKTLQDSEGKNIIKLINGTGQPRNKLTKLVFSTYGAGTT
jgi:hypothetical protein